MKGLWFYAMTLAGAALCAPAHLRAENPNYCGSTRKLAEASRPRNDSAVDGRALVYVIGTGTRMTMLAIAVDGNFIGVTGRDDYVAISLEPGTHHVCATSVRTKTRDALLKLTVDANKTYYVKEERDANGGWYYGQLQLILLDDDQGPDAMKRVKPAR